MILKGNCVEEVQVNQKRHEGGVQTPACFQYTGCHSFGFCFLSERKTDRKKISSTTRSAGRRDSLRKNIPVSSVINQYNKKGQIIKREETFPLPKRSVTHRVSKQVDVYEYDTYGYLTKNHI